MNYTYLHYQIGLSLLHNIGPKRARQIAELLPDLSHLFKWTIREIHQHTHISTTLIQKMNRKKALSLADEIIAYNTKHSIRSLFYTDPEYPRRLKSCDDAPIVIYTKGGVSLNQHSYVAVVGTRDATTYGKHLCAELIESIKGSDIIVVSGLAKGIDATIHQLCLDHSIPTIGVLGHGLDRIYPYDHRHLAQNMLHSGGIISEFVPGTLPDRENFPKRNRIVAGMTDATIVIESKLPGGSLITADLAFGYNKDVFAYPGDVFSPNSKGVNHLIASQKAQLIQSGADFLTNMGWKNASPPKNPQARLFVQLNENQQKITTQLSEGGLHVDVISYKTSLPASQLNAELFFLELEGIIEKLPGKIYRLI